MHHVRAGATPPLAGETSIATMADATVALDPGGFWNDPERRAFGASVALSARLLRLLRRRLPALTARAAGRTALLAQFSARPWRVPPAVALQESRTFADSPSFVDALRSLVHGPPQDGMPAGSARGPVVIG